MIKEEHQIPGRQGVAGRIGDDDADGRSPALTGLHEGGVRTGDADQLRGEVDTDDLPERALRGDQQPPPLATSEVDEGGIGQRRQRVQRGADHAWLRPGIDDGVGQSGMIGLGSDRLQLHNPAGVGSVQVIKWMPPIPAIAVKRAGSGHPPQHPAHAGVVEHRHQGRI